MARTSLLSRSRPLAIWTLAAAVAVGAQVGLAAEPAASPQRSAKGASKQAQIALGAELFSREWIPNDPRSHSGTTSTCKSRRHRLARRHKRSSQLSSTSTFDRNVACQIGQRALAE